MKTTEVKTAHTLPWSVFRSHGKIEIHDNFNRIVCEFFGNQDADGASAELIVRAANSHADLLQCLQDLIEGNQLLPGYHYEQARAAIAKAKPLT